MYFRHTVEPKVGTTELRQETRGPKVEDDSFYLLSLPAVKDLRNQKEESPRGKVTLLVGLHLQDLELRMILSVPDKEWRVFQNIE